MSYRSLGKSFIGYLVSSITQNNLIWNYIKNIVKIYFSTAVLNLIIKNFLDFMNTYIVGRNWRQKVHGNKFTLLQRCFVCYISLEFIGFQLRDSDWFISKYNVVISFMGRLRIWIPLNKIDNTTNFVEFRSFIYTML